MPDEPWLPARNRRHVDLRPLKVGALTAAGVLAAAALLVAVVRSEGSAGSPPDIRAVALTSSDAATAVVGGSSHSALVTGKTWVCSASGCPPGPSTVTVLDGTRVLATQAFDANLRFSIYVSGLPLARTGGSPRTAGGAELTVEASNGYRVVVRVASGARIDVPIPPVDEPGAVVAPVPGTDGAQATIYTWSGLPIRTLHALPGDRFPAVGTASAISPDGSRIVELSVSGGATVVGALSGTSLGSFDESGGSLWGGDSRHLCVLDRQATASSAARAVALLVEEPGAARRAVASLSSDPDETRLAACGIGDDAILESYSNGRGVAVTYVDLSTGAEAPATWYHPQMGSVEISGDGDYAVTDAGSVLATSTGDDVGHVSGQPVAISWLGHAVLVDDDGVPTVVDWQAHTAWTAPAMGGAQAWAATVELAARRVGSDEMAVVLAPTGTRAASLWVVSVPHARRITSDVAASSP